MTTAVSLFAGVGGFDLALTRCGVDVVAAVEIDKQARSVLERNFPGTKLFTDVQEVTGEQLIESGFDPSGGIITAGFPCQDLSVAGRRNGLEGVRSGLFWHIIRLAKETKAEWILIENVPGLLSSQRGRDMGIVLGALDELGYSVAWRVFDAQFFGVPQRRRRVFIVAHLGDGGGSPSEVLALGESGAGNFESVTAEREETSIPVGDGIASVYRLLAFGYYKNDGTFSTLKQRDYKDHTDLVTFVKAKRAQSNQDDESWREDSVSPTLNQFDSGDTRATVLVLPDVRRLTPTECERLQGFPDGWTAGQSDTARYKQMGNAVAVPVVEWIVRRIIGVSFDMGDGGV